MALFNSILCPVDFSEPSGAALRRAKHLALLVGAKLHVLHVVEPILVPADFAFGPITPVELEDQFARQSETKLQALSATAAAALDSPVEIKTRRGKPYLEIIAAAKELKPDLIVLGTHGLGGLTHVLMGSTAEKVVRKAPCGVLTVKAQTPPAA
jgi:universal stress protein A